MKYKIVNGKLADEKGNPVVLEFGNRDQIDFIKDYQRMLDEFNGDGVEVDVSMEAHYTASGYFRCTCGTGLYIEAEADDEDDEDCLVDWKKTCRICKTNYIIDKNDAGNIVAKINSTKP